MDNALEERLWGIAGRFLTQDNWRHGLPHIRRMLALFDGFFVGESLIAPVVLDAVRRAIYLHDIGRSRPEAARGHAWTSAIMVMELEEREGLILPPCVDLVLYAIANHSIGLGGEKAVDEKEMVLAILVLLDHTDTLGALGVGRIFTHMGRSLPLVPESRYGIAEIRFCLDHPGKITTADIPSIKDGSCAGRLAYNVACTGHILRQAEGLVPSLFGIKVRDRKKTTENFVRALLEEAGV